MISVRNAQMFCAEPIELIENYDKAVADQTQVWHCHHIWETMLGYSKEELIEMNEYYGIPACNLIFLTPEEHCRIHNKGKILSEETKEILREKATGRKQSEESNRKRRESMLGENNPFYEKHHTEETLKILSDKAKERFTHEKSVFYGKHHTEETKQILREKAILRSKDEEFLRKQREAKIGKFNTKISKPVLQYTLDGEFVAEYPSIAEVQRQLGYKHGCIARCARGERQYSYNYIWKYKK